MMSRTVPPRNRPPDGRGGHNPTSQETETSTEIIVTNLPRSCSEDLLMNYFENRRNFGDSMVVKGVTFDGEQTQAIVEFASPNGVEVVLSKGPCKLEDKILHIEEYRKPTAPPTSYGDYSDFYEVPVKSGPGDTATIEVGNYSDSTSDDALRYYFENEKRSGGGDTNDITFDREQKVAQVTFKDKGAVARVLKKSHVIDGKTLTVKPYITSDTDVLLKDLPDTLTEENLNNFIEAKFKNTVAHITFNEERSKAIVSFDKPADFRLITDACRKYGIDGSHIVAARVPISNCVIVTNLPEDQTKDSYQFYFELPKYGGGDVDKVDLHASDGYCLVYFHDINVVESVCKKKHTIANTHMHVKPYQTCLGIPASSGTAKFTFPSTESLSHIDGYKKKFLERNDTQRKALDEKLASCHGEVVWDANPVQIKCTLTTKVKGYRELSKAWKSKVTETFQQFIYILDMKKHTAATPVSDPLTSETGVRLLYMGYEGESVNEAVLAVRQQTVATPVSDPLTSETGVRLLDMGYEGESVNEAVLAVRQQTAATPVSDPLTSETGVRLLYMGYEGESVNEAVLAVRQQTAATRVSDPLTSETGVRLLDMGYEGESVNEAVLAVSQQTGRSMVTVEEVLSWILDEQDRRRAEIRPAVNLEDSKIVADSASQSFLCEQFVIGQCRNQSCRLLHSNRPRLPYVWQVKLYNVWVNIDQSEAVEMPFCEARENKCHVAIIDETGMSQAITICFEPDISGISSSGEKLSARRLSTKSYAVPEVKAGSFVTRWLWYWRDDMDSWQLFDTDAMQYTLESKFLYGQANFLYSRDNYRLNNALNFTGMYQLNLDTYNVLKIARRPTFVSGNDVMSQNMPSKDRLVSKPTAPVPLPSGWAPWDLAHPFELVELYPGHPDYIAVENSFFLTLLQHNEIIDNIYRVQCPALWNKFCSHRKSMVAAAERAGRGANIDERKLFHATDCLDTVRGICINNFDPRVSGKNGTVYGEGAYFAKNSKYSHAYSGNDPSERFVFQAIVLIGDFVVGNSSYRRPPGRPGAAHELYDSCVNNIDNPDIFVIFDRDQYYPEYLIRYHDRP